MAAPRTQCTLELAHKIAGFVRYGSYWEPACVAAGISYPTMRRWVQQAARDEDDGIEEKDSIFLQFRKILETATAEAETSLVKMISGTPDDWRAQAFILERRHRERWGKQETTVNQVNVVISDQLANQLADALSVAQAKSSAITLEPESFHSLTHSSSQKEIGALSRADSIEKNTPQYPVVTRSNVS